jgi:DHA2 family multidrug resistance protein
MPLMGWITCRISYKVLYLSCLFVFTAASGACALAWSYESLVAARLIQAIGAGAIQPIGMSIVAELFEPHERGRALGIWGTGIMVAPALGPTLGGYLTDMFSWRTIFSINLPIGVFTLLAGLLIMKRHRSSEKSRPLDVFGYGFLSMALIAGLTALSNGQDKGWSSDYIRTCWVLTAIGAVMFVGLELASEHPLFDLRLLLIRNYMLSIVLAVFRAVGLFGGVFLLPIFLQTLTGFTTVQSGLWMIPMAVSVGATMPIAGRLADRYSPAALVTAGAALVGVSLVMYGWLDPLSSWRMIVIPQIVRGVGLGLMMAPLLTAALNSVPREKVPMASSFLNVTQNFGGAIGIAVVNTYVTNSIHIHAVRVGEGLPMQSVGFMRLGAECQHLGFDFWQLTMYNIPGALFTDQLKPAVAAAEGMVRRAQVMGFQDGFVFAGLVVLASVPICLFLKPSAHHRRPAAGAEEIRVEAEIMDGA